MISCCAFVCQTRCTNPFCSCSALWCCPPPWCRYSPTDELIQRLVDDPNTFLRTTQTLGAESASVHGVITHKTRLSRLGYAGNVHAILWPTLVGSLLLLAATGYRLWKWKRARRNRQFMQSIATRFNGYGGPAGAFGDLSAGGLAGLMPGDARAVLTPRAYPLRHLRDTSSSSDGSGPKCNGDIGVAQGGSASLPERQGLSSRVSTWRRGWQRLWSSDVRVVLHSGSDRGLGGSRAVPNGSRSSGASGDGNSSGSASPGSSQSGRSDGLSVAIDLGDVGVSSAAGFCDAARTAGLPLSEESFTARLRAKQLHAQLGASGMLSSRHERAEGCW